MRKWWACSLSRIKSNFTRGWADYVDEQVGWDKDDIDSDSDDLLDHPGSDFDSYDYTSRRRRQLNPYLDDEGYQGPNARTKCVVLSIILLILVISVSDRGSKPPGGRFDPIANDADIGERNFTNETDTIHATGNETIDVDETERNFTNETDTITSTLEGGPDEGSKDEDTGNQDKSGKTGLKQKEKSVVDKDKSDSGTKKKTAKGIKSNMARAKHTKSSNDSKSGTKNLKAIQQPKEDGESSL